MKNNKFKIYKEKNKHGSTLFPFVIYDNLIPEFFTQFPIHWHEEVEIVYVHKGMAIYNIDYNRLIVEEGDILYISPSTLHDFAQFGNNNFKSSVFVFNLSIINNTLDICANKYFSPLLNNKCNSYFILKKSASSYNEIKNCLDNILKYNANMNSFFELQIKSELLKLMYLFFSENLIQIYTSKTENKSTILIKKIITYLKENYQNNITLQDLSKKFNLSPYHISHVFKKSTNMTCIDFLIAYRLNMASTLLYTTDLPILAIALECGFNNISYFNRAFKKQFNTTPTEHRLKHKNKL